MGVKGLSESPTMTRAYRTRASCHFAYGHSPVLTYYRVCRDDSDFQLINSIESDFFLLKMVMCTSGSIETLIPNQNILIHNLRRAAYIERHR